MKFFTFYHFDPDPRFPHFYYMLGGNLGFYFVQRCLLDALKPSYVEPLIFVQGEMVEGDARAYSPLRGCTEGVVRAYSPWISCSLCGKLFNNEGEMLRHLRTHLKFKTWACDTCDKIFYKKEDSISHMRTHQSECRTSSCLQACVILTPSKPFFYMKPAFCKCENKDADQLRGNREGVQRLCFRYMDITIPLLSKFEISSL